MGNVLLNRVAHPSFPSTLYDVIYQPGQFYPEKTGCMEKTPNEGSVIAAKLCLEGAVVVPDAYWFNSARQELLGIAEQRMCGSDRRARLLRITETETDRKVWSPFFPLRLTSPTVGYKMELLNWKEHALCCLPNTTAVNTPAVPWWR